MYPITRIQLREYRIIYFLEQHFLQRIVHFTVREFINEYFFTSINFLLEVISNMNTNYMSSEQLRWM